MIDGVLLESLHPTKITESVFYDKQESSLWYKEKEETFERVVGSSR